jgi:hypothetical protein
MVDALRRLLTKSQSWKRLTTAMIAVDSVRNVCLDLETPQRLARLINA